MVYQPATSSDIKKKIVHAISQISVHRKDTFKVESTR